MRLEGGCHCGAVRYVVDGEASHIAVCHCTDCRRSSGAPIVSWAAFKAGDVSVSQGEMTSFNSSGVVERSFCPRCGTGLFYRNEAVIPGLVDILQSATLDDPDALPPTAQIQIADRIGWMKTIHELSAFERFPGE
jgi:hypothetical protein